MSGRTLSGLTCIMMHTASMTFFTASGGFFIALTCHVTKPQ
jgi:hypothetical protein